MTIGHGTELDARWEAVRNRMIAYRHDIYLFPDLYHEELESEAAQLGDPQLLLVRERRAKEALKKLQQLIKERAEIIAEYHFLIVEQRLFKKKVEKELKDFKKDWDYYDAMQRYENRFLEIKKMEDIKKAIAALEKQTKELAQMIEQIEKGLDKLAQELFVLKEEEADLKTKYNNIVAEIKQSNNEFKVHVNHILALIDRDEFIPNLSPENKELLKQCFLNLYNIMSTPGREGISTNEIDSEIERVLKTIYPIDPKQKNNNGYLTRRIETIKHIIEKFWLMNNFGVRWIKKREELEAQKIEITTKLDINAAQQELREKKKEIIGEVLIQHKEKLAEANHQLIEKLNEGMVQGVISKSEEKQIRDELNKSKDNIEQSKIVNPQNGTHSPTIERLEDRIVDKASQIEQVENKADQSIDDISSGANREFGDSRQYINTAMKKRTTRRDNDDEEDQPHQPDEPKSAASPGPPAMPKPSAPSRLLGPADDSAPLPKPSAPPANDVKFFNKSQQEKQSKPANDNAFGADDGENRMRGPRR